MGEYIDRVAKTEVEADTISFKKFYEMSENFPKGTCERLERAYKRAAFHKKARVAASRMRELKSRPLQALDTDRPKPTNQQLIKWHDEMVGWTKKWKEADHSEAKENKKVKNNLWLLQQFNEAQK